MFGLLFLLVGLEVSYGQASEYNFRRKITIDNAMVSGGSNLTDFPYAVDLTDNQLRTTANGGDVQNANGYDIIFTAADGTTILDHELEYYNGSSGQYVAWVRIPTLYHSVDTEIYIYYGNAAISVDPSTTDTWISDYIAVWHLAEDAAGTTTNNLYRDATGNGNHGHDRISATGKTGRFGPGQEFGGLNSNDYIDLTVMNPRTYNQFTFSLWYRSSINLVQDDQYIFDHYDGSSWFHVGITDDGTEDDHMRVYFEVNGSGGRYYYGNIDVVDQTWHNIVFVRNATHVLLYVDGVLDISIVDSDPGEAFTINGTGAYMGDSPGDNEEIDGFIDEVRFMSTPQSADWLATEQNNQLDPTTYSIVDPVEVVDPPGGVAADLSLWLKSVAGTSSTTDGAAISSWSDQSGQGNGLSQGNGTFQPRFRNNATNNINYHPVLDFDGTDDGMSDASGFLGTDAYTDVNVYYVLVTDVVTTSFVLHENCSPNRFSTHVPWSDGTYYWDAGDFAGNYRLSGTWGGTTGDPHLWSNLFSTTSGQTIAGQSQAIIRDGESVAVDNTAGTVTGTGQSLYVGSNGGTTNYFDGKIAEVAIYTDALSSADHNKIQSYLAMKYGLTLSNSGGGTAGDYTASDGTTVWDADLNAGYHQHVVVIGRDDDSDLYQRQSHTPDDSLRVYLNTLTTDNASNTGTITNDVSFLAIGHNGERLYGRKAEKPASVYSRLAREWKITNTNFTDTYSIEFEWEEIGAVNTADLRLLVDADGDFSSGATAYSTADGLTFTLGSIIVGGINTSHVPLNSTSYVTIASLDSGTPLPVELIGFEASATEEGDVALRWSTASEQDNDFFTIQRSLDAQQWENVVIVPGAGNSEERIDYEALDDNPVPGNSYYRLKQTDFDGSFDFSSVVKVTVGETSSGSFSLYPNPAHDRLTLSGSLSDVRELKVFDALGDDVTHLVKTSVGQSTGLFTLDVSLLNTGVFFLSTEAGVYVRFLKN